MKTITTIIKTDAFKYAIFAFLTATVVFFAVLPFVSDINQHATGPSLTAFLVTADDGGGDSGSGDSGSGDSGSGDSGSGSSGGGDTGVGTPGDGCCGDGSGSGETGTGSTGSGETGVGTPSDGCCGDTAGTPTDSGSSSGGEISCSPIWDGCGGYWYQNSCIYSCPAGTHTDRVTGANDAQYCGLSYNTCEPNPVEIEPACSISANPNPCTLGANSLCASSISWSTENMSNPAVFVESTGQKFAASKEGSQLAPWINYSSTKFVVKEQSGSAPVICSVSVSGVCPTGTSWNGSACVAPVIPAPTCTLTASPTSINQGSASTLSWTTSNATSVTLNEGIGVVAVSGSRSVSPSVTKTYTLTADGAGGTVTCSKTVTVLLPTPSTPSCTISANPNPCTLGSNGQCGSTISWSTQNMTDPAVYAGSDSQTFATGKSGTKLAVGITASPTTFVVRENDGGFSPRAPIVCSVSVVGIPVHTPAPTCTLTASPTSINQGSASTLSWTTSNATSVIINQGVGAVGSSGSKSVSPSNTTSYTLTATGAGGTVTCEKQVTVVVPNPAPTCTLTASPTSINQGGASTLSWTTTNASSVTLNEGIGAVVANGSRSVSPSVTKTYTLTADGAGGTVTCSETVMVVVPNPAPTCTITVNPQSITRGESATLSWSTTNATAIVIDNNIGTVSLSGTRSVSPTVTTEYKLSAVGAGGSVLCKTTLAVGEAPVAPTCALNANKTSITAGESVTLTWNSTNANQSTLQGTNVALSGSGVYTPATTTTYTYVVTGAGGSQTCTKTITVTPYVPAVPVCALTVSPNKITKGSSATLNWTVGNASVISLDQGIGTISATGSRSVNPSGNTTYTLTARGEANQTVTCVASLVVEEPHIDDPVKCDAFSASPSTLNAAGTTTLTWNTSNATNVSIDNGVGTVSEDGSKSIFVATNTTYTLTATDGEKTVTCQSQVNIVPVVTVPKCDAFSVSPSSLNKGETATLTWNTTNASSVSINNGVGTVAVDGNTTVTVNSDTTYTLTATNGSASDTCQATVTIKSSGGGGGGGSSAPRCTLTASDKKITPGQEVTLTWKNTRTNDILLKDNRGNVLADSKKNSKVDEDAGSIKVKPTKSTSYTLTAIKGSKKRDCTVDINVSNVSVTSNRSLVAGISLSKVPYTGFDAGPFLTTVFYSLLVLWGLGIAYMLVFKGNSNTVSLRNAKPVQVIPEVVKEAPVHRIPSVLVAPTVTVAPQNLKAVNPVVGYESLYATVPSPMTEEVTEVVAEPEVEDTTALLEGHAHDARVLMSSDALRFIASQSALVEEQLAILDKVIGLAKAQYPSENGWVIVNKEKMMSLLA